MQESKCCFCGDEITFGEGPTLVRITIEYAVDGAGQFRKYWAHAKCLPEELKSDG